MPIIEGNALKTRSFKHRLISIFALILLCGCGSQEDKRTELTFWAMGNEGEKVKGLLGEFERRNPNYRVKLQQIPWSAAHEKLLTAFAGDAMPDLFQLGNTWVPEFVAMQAIEPLGGRLNASPATREDFFEGVLTTQEIHGIPWYVDTRVMFYRKDLLAQAGYAEPPHTWAESLKMMAAIQQLPGKDRYALYLPMNEWQMPIILGLQFNARLLRDNARFGDFSNESFRRAFDMYLEFFRQHYAPAVADAQISNLYQEFANGYFAIYITGPWNLGKFHEKLPKSLQGQWMTAPLPSPDDTYPGVSLAGGASLAISSHSPHPADAWKLIEFLTEPSQQVAFYLCSGNLPTRKSAWKLPFEPISRWLNADQLCGTDTAVSPPSGADLASDEKAAAFFKQLDKVSPLPIIPEWERIADKVAHYAEKTVRGEMSEADALQALDYDVDQILEKRRWLLDRRK